MEKMLQAVYFRTYQILTKAKFSGGLWSGSVMQRRDSKMRRSGKHKVETTARINSEDKKSKERYKK